jgi:hypothetical protein
MPVISSTKSSAVTICCALAALALVAWQAHAVPRATRKAKTPVWKYANATVRSAIASALTLPEPRGWERIVLHSSATKSGNARAFDYFHRKVKKMANGLAYHFVITNGNGGPDGQIQVGSRWLLQQAGGHLRSEEQNETAIGICFVGDFQTQRPTSAQLAAAQELIKCLRAKAGPVAVTTHRQINVKPTLCPGKYFPTGVFVPRK